MKVYSYVIKVLVSALIDLFDFKCCESAAPNMSANLENSAVAIGLEKVSFIPITRKTVPTNAQATAQLYSSHTLVK